MVTWTARIGSLSDPTAISAEVDASQACVGTRKHGMSSTVQRRDLCSPGRNIPGFVLCAYLALACSPISKSVVSPPSATISDSAGVQIVASLRFAWRGNESWTVTSEPESAVGWGSTRTEQQLHKVSGAIRLTDGRLVIADPSSGVRYFSAKGEFLQRSGRYGDGPGEYRGIRSLHRLRGDSLLVVDARNFALVYDDSGRFVRSHLIAPGDLSANLIGVLANGTTFLNLMGEGHKAAQAGYRTISSRGIVLAEFGSRSPRRLGAQFGPNVSYAMVLKGSAPAPERYYVLAPGFHEAVGGDGLFAADAATAEVRVYSPEGRLLRIIRVTSPRDKIPDHIKADSSLNIGNVSYHARETIWPEFYPAHSEILVDVIGNLWTRQIPRPNDAADKAFWWVFDSTGVLLGDVALPARIGILEIGSDYLLGLDRDQMDVERIGMYRINKPVR